MNARITFFMVMCGLMLIADVGALTEQEALERGSTLTTEQEKEVQKQKSIRTGVQDLKRVPLSSNLLSGGDDFNVEVKSQAVIDLVERGLKFMQDNDIDQAFNMFTHGKDFIKGELYLFVYDMDHVCFAHGQEAELVWQDFSHLKDIFGTYIVRQLVSTAQQGGGWVTYQWRNATKKSYVKKITKDGKSYVIGSGFYPHSKRDSVVSLVKGATSYFRESIERGQGSDDVFSTLSYPFGRFVVGDLYLYAVRYDGTMVANGDRPGLIGLNVINSKDSKGKFINQEIIAGLKANPEGVWIDYQSKNASKSAYAQEVIDSQGVKYFIACGYYPDADRRKLITLVKDGYEFMKKNGLSVAAEEFTSRTKDAFRYGDLYLMVYTLDGVCVAHGKNPDFVGTNQLDLQDEDGRYFVKEMIAKAKQGGNWVDFKLKNAFAAVYVEPIDLGVQNYIIASSFYPVSKRETALLLVRSGAGVMRTTPNKDAFSQFGNKKGTFIRGDLGVFVIDFKGICRIYSDTYDLIWRNLMDARDDNGKQYVKLFINTARQGSGQITYTINGIKRIAFVEKVTKDGIDYVVGSGYFV